MGDSGTRKLTSRRALLWLPLNVGVQGGSAGVILGSASGKGSGAQNRCLRRLEPRHALPAPRLGDP